jgi:hypothetical protein
MGAAVESILLHAMRKGLIECDGASTAEVTAHPPDFTATAKGHMKMYRQGLQSTMRVETESGIKAAKKLMKDLVSEAELKTRSISQTWQDASPTSQTRT